MMKVCVLTFCVTLTLCAADERQLALALKAQTAFERVELSAKPTLADAENCQQSEAAALSIAPPEEAAILHFRKGWCALVGAVATGRLNQPTAALAEFDRAREAWPARMGRNNKNAPPEPLSSGLRAITAILHMQAGEDARAELTDVIDHPNCYSNLMSADFCRQLLEISRQWLGWIALRENRLDDASKLLSWSTDSGWSQWVQGRRAFDSGAYKNAVADYTDAITIWKSIWSDPALLRALGPRPNMPVALTDLGGAQMLAGDVTASIRTLDTAIKADPSQAHPLFLRARAKEISGQADAALADYNLAARTAFASAQDLASGEAHLYRGILLYRRKDYPRAETEFANALNFDIPNALRGDAAAWRYAAAVADGSCGSARDSLLGSLSHVSPFFPTDEIRSLANSCGGTALKQ